MNDEKQKRDYLAKLATSCQELARNLTFNEGSREFTIKHVLLESSFALDGLAVSVSKKSGRLTITNARGKSRNMTWRERLGYFILGTTSIRP